MLYYRITKYESKYRDQSDRFITNTWTSVSDIGRETEGSVLLYDDYISYEIMYVHFGYDYYMYVGSRIELDSSCIPSKLFIENFKSPYL